MPVHNSLHFINVCYVNLNGNQPSSLHSDSSEFSCRNSVGLRMRVRMTHFGTLRNCARFSCRGSAGQGKKSGWAAISIPDIAIDYQTLNIYKKL